MTRAALLLCLAALSACSTWNWREAGRAALESHCRFGHGCQEICRDAPDSDMARRLCP